MGELDDSMVAVLNLPPIAKRPVGVLAVSKGSLFGCGAPPRPAEIIVAYLGTVPSNATSQPPRMLASIQVPRPTRACPVVSGCPTGAPQGVVLLGVGTTASWSFTHNSWPSIL